jgi:hypothetical protein
MKNIILISGILFFSVTQLWSQEKNNISYPVLGEDAPSFTAESSHGTLNFTL